MAKVTIDSAVRVIEDILDRGAFTPGEVENILNQIRFDINHNFILYRERAEKEQDNEP